MCVNGESVHFIQLSLDFFSSPVGKKTDTMNRTQINEGLDRQEQTGTLEKEKGKRGPENGSKVTNME